MQNENLTKEYYENFDINIFHEKLKIFVEKIQSLKEEKDKKVYYTELYATYIQVVEIFCINSFAISDRDLLTNIFLGTNAIQEKIRSRFFEERNEKGQTFIEYLVSGFVFDAVDKKKDRDAQKRNYIRFTKEAVEDYAKDKDFLNSYKHGFRVLSGEKNTLSIGITGGQSMMKVSDYSASVSYYKKIKETGTIAKCDIFFNWERVYAKSIVLLNLLGNMRRVYLHETDTDVQLITFDNKLLDPTFGCFRVCNEIT